MLKKSKIFIKNLLLSIDQNFIAIIFIKIISINSFSETRESMDQVSILTGLTTLRKIQKRLFPEFKFHPMLTQSGLPKVHTQQFVSPMELSYVVAKIFKRKDFMNIKELLMQDFLLMKLFSLRSMETMLKPKVQKI